MTDTFAKIGVFSTEKPIMLTPYPNGGWTVTQPGDRIEHMHKEVGAYSSAADLIAALADALNVVQP